MKFHGILKQYLCLDFKEEKEIQNKNWNIMKAIYLSTDCFPIALEMLELVTAN